jgi:ribosomal RNA-processing protein 1
MWSADKLPIQEHLAERLSSVIARFQNWEMVIHYLDGFWNILMIEWNGIDRLRQLHYTTVLIAVLIILG